jgi:glycosyltransferase involved in cell wall biosynthesis
MAYGVVPVAGNVGSIPQYLNECGVGATFDPYDIDGFVTAIIDYARDRARWQAQSTQSVRAAGRFTYDDYLQNISRLLDLERSAAPS